MLNKLADGMCDFQPFRYPTQCCLNAGGRLADISIDGSIGIAGFIKKKHRDKDCYDEKTE